MPALRVLPGGRSSRSVLLVSASGHDELHVELLSARAERTVHAARARWLIRSALRYLAAGHMAATGTALLDLDKLTEQEARRALAMTAPCPCGYRGPGHGRADADALAVPVRRAA